MQQLGIGIVGYGFIGKIHALAYRTIDLIYSPRPAVIRLVGVATSRPETAAAAQEHGGFEFGTCSYTDLLARDDIQVINICTPNDSHFEIAMAALRAGKHVYCDKPIALTSDQARQMVELAEKTGLVNMMTFQNRFIPATMRAHQLVDEGLLGRIYQFRAQYLHAGYVDPDRPITWRLDRSRGGGGAMYDLGSHAIDLVRYLIGEFDEVSGVLHTFVNERPTAEGSPTRMPVEVDDACIINAKMQNGSIGVIEASRFATGSNDDLTLEVHGSLGALRFSLMDPNFLYFYDNTSPNSPMGGLRGYTRIETVQRYEAPALLPGPKCPVGWTRFHTQCLWTFVNAVIAGGVATPSFVDGLKAQEVMEAVETSAAGGSRWVSL